MHGTPVTGPRKTCPSRTFQLNITPVPVFVEHFSEQNRTPVSQLRHKVPELMPRVSLRQRIRALRHGIAREPCNALRPRQHDRIDAAQNRSSVLKDQVVALEKAQQLDVTAAKLKVKMATQKLKAEQQKLDAARAELETANANLERSKRLMDRGLVSTRQLELALLDQRKAEAAENLAEAAVSEAEACWSRLVSDLERRGLASPVLIVSDGHRGLAKAIEA